MSTPVAKPAHCHHCGSAIWEQHTPGLMRADVARLQNAAEELTCRLWGRWTYQAFKTGTGFELVPRFSTEMNDEYQTKIVLADHQCATLPTTEHPDYWPTLKGTITNDTPPF